MTPIRVNPAPVLTLWAGLVAEALGHDRDMALRLGAAIGGTAAPSPPGPTCAFLGRDVAPGMAAGQPEATARYLARAFGPRLAEVEAAMRDLIARIPPAALDGAALALFARFRPEMPEGGKGRLDLAKIRAAALSP